MRRWFPPMDGSEASTGNRKKVSVNGAIDGMVLQGLSFRHALRFTHAERPDSARILVRYKTMDSTIFNHAVGVYLVRHDNDLIYVGSYHHGFRKRWLYARDEYLYHFKHVFIAGALDEGHQVDVFAESEDELKKQLGLTNIPWITALGIEDRLIRDLRPPWNGRN